MVRVVIACVWFGGCVVDVPVFVERDADTSDTVHSFDTSMTDTLITDTSETDTGASVDSDTGASVDGNPAP